MTEAVHRLWARERVETWLGRGEGEGLARFRLLHRARGPAAEDPLQRARFVQCVRSAAALRNPVLERVEAIDAETPAFCIPLTPGITAQWALERLQRSGRGTLPLPVAVYAVLHAAEAIAYAFDHGLRFGGLSAARLQLDFEGRVHLFGLLERLASEDAPAPTASVIYGLGTTFLALATGAPSRLPAAGELPPELDEIARRALGEGEAYPHPRAFAEALAAWLEADPRASRLDAARLGAWVKKVAGKRLTAWTRAAETEREEAGRLLHALLRRRPGATSPPAQPPPEPVTAEPERAPPVEATEAVPEPEPVVPQPPEPPRGSVQASGLLEDPREDLVLVPGATLDEVLDPLVGGEPTGDPGSAPCVEILRVAGGVVVEVVVLHEGQRFKLGRGAPLIRMTGGHAELKLPAGGAGRFIGHLGEVQALEAGARRLEPGDRAEVELDGVTYRVRVDRAARAAGRATGVRFPWRLYGGAVVAALLGHVLLLGGLVGFADRMDLRVQRPDEAEVFASIKPPSELPEAKPKPPAPKPKPKPKPKRQRKVEAPPDPAEARPDIPEPVRKRLNARLKKRRSQAKDTASALIEALNEPGAAGAGLDVKSVAKAMDAVRGPGGDALEVASTAGSEVGADLKIGGGGGTSVDTLGGSELKGKGAGRLSGRKKPKRVRGKVKTMRALAKVGCDVDRAAVRKAVSRKVGKLQGCYERQLLRREGLSGKVHVEWSIDAKGRAKGVRVRVATLGDPKVVSCVLGVIRKTRFPPVKGGRCTISWPFVFSPVR